MRRQLEIRWQEHLNLAENRNNNPQASNPVSPTVLTRAKSTYVLDTQGDHYYQEISVQPTPATRVQVEDRHKSEFE
jgi:hypothetical protein